MRPEEIRRSARLIREWGQAIRRGNQEAQDDEREADLGDMPGCDVVAYYGCKISTNRGEILIDYRNDSNGYYGGSLWWPGEGHYGGVYWQNVSGRNWRDIAP